jgi:hypothetical protein
VDPASQTQVPAALLLLHGPPPRPHPRKGADLVPVPDPGLRQLEATTMKWLACQGRTSAGSCGGRRGGDDNGL